MAEPILVTLRFSPRPTPPPPQNVRISYTLKPDAVLRIDPTKVAKLPYTIFRTQTNLFGLRVEAFQAGQPLEGVELNVLGRTVKTDSTGISPYANVEYGKEVQTSVKLPLAAQSINVEDIRKDGIDISIIQATAPPPTVVSIAKLYNIGSASFNIEMLEGDYSTWNLKWSANIFDLTGYDVTHVLGCRISGEKLFISIYGYDIDTEYVCIFDLDTGNLLEHFEGTIPIDVTPYTAVRHTNTQSYTITGKYVLVNRWTPNWVVEVYKDGNKIWELSESETMPAPLGFFASHDGKYILIHDNINNIYLFEGS